ncbi:MAG: tRNA (N(6)-L-threonylcarbamoyladenosine(37)-C(2))-methylthiotransferase MtaB [Opitutaceae bacterium]|nr:tRNA (N(6)-L-threonylcarbamoyladenosine(37)-C(2))-methylthiotransferase MtaB [Cytophagales bacterium]
MKKVAFYTLGCKLNFSETSSISRMFEERSFEKVDFTDRADVYVINTCSVTDNADKKCRKVVKEALKHSPGAFIVIMGCYAQLKPKEISEIPGVDAVLGASEKFRLFDVLGNFEKSSAPIVYNSPINEVRDFNNAFSLNDRTRTFLKVQDGCDYSCTFCTIPLARGSSRSATIDSVLNDVETIAKTGVKEIVLTGVNIGDFGIVDGFRNESFFGLIQKLDNFDGIDRFRISSIEPNLLSNEIISFVASSEKFVHHFHIPLQSGSNKTLRAMRRRYLKELYEERVTSIKALMPDCCIGVDVIVGFPGETNQDFLETYSFLNDLEVSYLHVFTYSERDNTIAAEMGSKVPDSERAKRSKMLHILSDKKKRAFYETQIGKEAEVLFENDVENGIMFGFTRNYIKVAAKYDPLLVNEIKIVKLSGVSADGYMEVVEIDSEILIHS